MRSLKFEQRHWEPRALAPDKESRVIAPKMSPKFASWGGIRHLSQD